MKNPIGKHLQPLTAHDYIGAASWIAIVVLFSLLILRKI